MKTRTQANRAFRMATASLVAIPVLAWSSAPVSSAPASDATQKATQNAIDLIKPLASANGVFVFDYGVPSSPALNLIGLTPDKTTVSTGLKPFVLSLPQLVSGGASQSAALDIAPLWLLGSNDHMGYDDYTSERSNYFDRFAYRFRTELALYTGDDGGGTPAKAKPSQIAFGFSIPLLDDSDPLMAVNPAHPNDGTGWQVCLQSHIADLQPYTYLPKDVADKQREVGYENVKLIPAADAGLALPVTDLMRIEGEIGVTVDQIKGKTPEQRTAFDRVQADAYIVALDKPSTQEAAANTKALKIISGCTDDANRYARFAPNLSFGAGVDMQGTPGSLGGFKNSYAVLWLSGKYPLGLKTLGDKMAPDVSDGGTGQDTGKSEFDYWMVGGSARASFGDFVATGDAGTPKIKANTFNGWLGLERNSNSFVFSAQAGYQDVSATNPAQAAFSRSGWRWLTSASLKLSSEQNGIWLDASYGSAQGTTQTLDDKTFMLSLNFGPANSANLFGENPSK